MIRSPSPRVFAQRCAQLWPLTMILACGLLGCESDGVKTVPVNGRITFNGGDWPTAGLVVFAPQEPAPGYPRRAGEAIFFEDGSFEASTFAPQDGLIPGVYLVNLRCFESSAADITQGTDHVPEKYRRGETSGFQVTVPADQREALWVEFDVRTE